MRRLSTNVPRPKSKFTLMTLNKMDFQNKKSKAKCIGNYELKQTLGEGGEIFVAFFTMTFTCKITKINEKKPGER